MTTARTGQKHPRDGGRARQAAVRKHQQRDRHRAEDNAGDPQRCQPFRADDHGDPVGQDRDQRHGDRQHAGLNMRRGEIEQAVRKRGAEKRDNDIDLQMPPRDRQRPPPGMGEGQQHQSADNTLPEGDPERRTAGKRRNPGQRKGQAPDGAEEQQDDPGKESLRKGSGEERHVVASMKRRGRRKRVNRTGRHPPYSADTAPEIRPPSRREQRSSVSAF